MKHLLMNSTFFISVLLIFSFMACQKPNPQGYWIETNNFHNPLIIKFDSAHSLIQNLNVEMDTANCTFGWNTITFTSKDTAFAFEYEMHNDTLYLAHEDKIYQLVKAQKPTFYEELISKLPIEIDLPEGRGLVQKFYWSYGLLYIGYEENKNQPVYYFNGEKLDSINGILGYKALACINEEIDYPLYLTILLADKNIPYSIIKDVQEEHEKAGLYKFIYSIINIEFINYQSIIGFKQRISERFSTVIPYDDSLIFYMPLRPPEPLPYLSLDYEIPLLQLNDSALIYENDVISYQDLSNKMKEEIKKTNNKVVFLYQINPETKYLRFIEFLDIANNIFLELRNEFAKAEYGEESYTNLPYSVIYKIESAYPTAIFEVNSRILSIIYSRGEGVIE